MSAIPVIDLTQDTKKPSTPRKKRSVDGEGEPSVSTPSPAKRARAKAGKANKKTEVEKRVGVDGKTVRYSSNASQQALERIARAKPGTLFISEWTVSQVVDVCMKCILRHG